MPVVTITEAAKLYGCSPQAIQDRLDRKTLKTAWRNEPRRCVELSTEEFKKLSSQSTCADK